LITAKNIKNISDIMGQDVNQKGIELLIAKVNMDPHGSFNFEQYMKIMA
jgi:Ca2+-binding EF-hand superfamily protein